MKINSSRTEQINQLLWDLIELIDEPVLTSEKDQEITVSLTDEVRLFEKARICDALRRANGSQRKAARLLGVNPTTLNYKIKRNGVDISPYCVIKMNKK